MRFFFSLCVLAVFAACSSPGRQFATVDPVQVVVEGSVFDVYVVGDEVRAVRTNFEMLPTLATIGPRMVAAIETATGCPVVSGSFFGDQAMSQARVYCG